MPRYRAFRQERPRARLLDLHHSVHGETEEQARALASSMLEIPLDQIRLEKA